MNRTAKTVLIVALCLFGVGLLVFFGSSVVKGYRLSDVGRAGNEAAAADDESYKTIEKELEDGRQDIEIDVSFVSVTVAPSTDGKIHLTYTQSARVTFDYQADAEKISLRQAKSTSSFPGVLEKSAKVELLLPEEHAGDLEIGSASGNIRLSNVSIGGDLELGTASGSITSEGCSCNESDFGSASGDIELSRLETGSVNVGTASGYIGISDVSGAPDAELSSASGDIRVSLSKLGELEADTNSGSLLLSDVVAKSCYLKSTSGVCGLDGVDSKSIRVGTISGGIRGTLSGAPEDYTISTKSHSGANSLQNLGGRGERTLTVTTTSGDIALDFAD